MGSGKITRKQREWVREAIRDPVLFAERILGLKLWDKQVELLRSIRDNRKTAVKACHASGKTLALGVAALWWLARYPDGIVLTTSATLRQVRTQLWAEIRRLAAGAKIAFPEPNVTELKLRGEANYALGLSTGRAEHFQGYHGKHVLVIADEASAISSEIWEAVEGITAGGDVHIVMAGNPINPSGPFFDAFHSQRSLWSCISIDAFETPNLAGLDLDQLLLQMDPAPGGPLDQNPFPFLVSRRWVYEAYPLWWHGDEASSPAWLSRVRGRFPDQAEDTLIKLHWLERAKERALRQPVQDGGRRLVAGVDVGGGNAETVVYVCELMGRRRRIIDLGAWRAVDTRGHVVRFLSRYRDRLTAVRVDATGIGHNFALHLRDQGFAVELVQVGLPCLSRPDLGDNDPARRFANQKARLYQHLADLLERDELDGLVDEETIAQLADLRHEIDSRGRMRIESKQKVRARRGSSPDRAEALMLAIGEPREPMLWLQEDLVGIYHREGRSNEYIADELEMSVEEVEAALRRQTQRALDQYRARFDKSCALCDAPLGETRTRIMGEEYHEHCGRKVNFGIYAK